MRGSGLSSYYNHVSDGECSSLISTYGGIHGRFPSAEFVTKEGIVFDLFALETFLQVTGHCCVRDLIALYATIYLFELVLPVLFGFAQTTVI